MDVRVHIMSPQATMRAEDCGPYQSSLKEVSTESLH
jgi:hypothetical protein